MWCPTARLNHIFRQAAGSMIVQGAHAIRRGEIPEFKAAEGMRHDLFMMERGSAREALELIVELVSERLPKHYGIDPVEDIQVFAPVYKGDLGIDALNRALRDALNPPGSRSGGGRLRLGDKLMMTGRNLHELGLMNGTVLRLLDEIPGSGDDDAALLLSADEQMFRLPPEESEACASAMRARSIAARASSCRSPIIVAHERCRRVLPAAGDALHGHHPRQARDGDRRLQRGCGAGRADAGYRPALLAAGRALAQPALTRNSHSPTSTTSPSCS